MPPGRRSCPPFLAVIHSCSRSSRNLRRTNPFFREKVLERMHLIAAYSFFGQACLLSHSPNYRSVPEPTGDRGIPRVVIS